MKTILVPTDFSVEADYAMEVAARIAAKTGATIELLHIIEDLPHQTFSAGGEYLPEDPMDRIYVKKLIEKAHEQLHTRMQSKIVAGIPLNHTVKVGNVFKHIGQSIAEEKVDLIVMGTKGASGLQELLVGSNTEKVVRSAPCSVIAVREKVSSFDLKNVVLAVNFEENYTSFLNKLKEWQQLFGFTLHLLHVNTPLNFDTTINMDEKMAIFSKKHHLQHYTFTIINDYTYASGISSFAGKVKADMIVMLTHGRTGISFLMDGSVTSSVVNHAHMPVMSYKIKN